MDEEILPSPKSDASVAVLEPAGFWVRGGALLIDALILMPFGFLSIRAMKLMGFGLWATLAVPSVIAAVYHIGCVGEWGQTVGKKAAGIEILAADGGKAGYGRAAGRFAAHYLSALMLNIGYLMAVWMDGKKTLHDLIAGTRVVYRPGTDSGRRTVLTILGVLYPVASVAAGAYLGVKLARTVNAARAAFAAENRGDHEAAEAQFDRLIELQPQTAVWWNGRCWDRALIGKNLQGALSDCEESLRLKPLAATYDSRGMVYLRMRRWDDAFASYDEALKLDPAHPSALFGRGIARIARGDKAGAEKDFQEAEAREPGIGAKYRSYGVP